MKTNGFRCVDRDNRCMTVLGIARNEELYLPGAGSRFPAKSCDCTYQAGHNGFDVLEERSPAFSVLISWSETRCFIVCPTVHADVPYPIAEKKKLAKLSHQDEVATPARFLLVGRGYSQHR